MKNIERFQLSRWLIDCLLSGIALPLARPTLMSRVELCQQIESHTCRIAGERYTFRVRATGERHAEATPPNHTVLQVEAFRVDGAHYSVARMRITAPTAELTRIPSLLTQALEQWFLATAVPTGSVH